MKLREAITSETPPGYTLVNYYLDIVMIAGEFDHIQGVAEYEHKNGAMFCRKVFMAVVNTLTDQVVDAMPMGESLFTAQRLNLRSVLSSNSTSD